MSIVISCEACGARLKVPEDSSGRKVKCPKCRGVFVASSFDITAVPAARPQPLPPLLRPEPEELPDFEEVPDEGEEPERPRRKKKKKKRKSKEKVPSAADGWMLWGGAALGFFTLDLFLLLLACAGVLKPMVLYVCLWMLVFVPVSAVVLIISMFVSSAIYGGIDFGDARVTVPKALVLLFLIGPIYLLPFGFLLALPIWYGALMYLFKLDITECRVLVAVDWALNWAATFVLFAILAAAYKQSDKADPGAPGAPGGGAPPAAFQQGNDD